MLGRVVNHEFARFLVVGTVCALVNLLSGWCYQRILEGTPYWVGASVTFGFFMGTLASYVLNKFVTFRVNDERTWPEIVRFALVSIVSNLIGGLLAEGLFQGLSLLPSVFEPARVASIAHILSIGMMVIPNYLAIKYIAFARAGFFGSRRRKVNKGDETADCEVIGFIQHSVAVRSI